ncbi:MAG: 7-cyano-7-deazaguanine synthase QueC [Sulfurovaceae bacterium]|nr:7-cyano-7-deazaguanine synthase QueC [Sulfurovaceae bacterium]MDD5549147.1 7-cyano-7-deazaguanine synthase QueC [Sulfurovaceae bacterium]
MVKKAVCVISGGMDSTLSAKIAQNDGYEVIGVHYNYLQRTEQKELEAFRNVVDALGIKTKYEIDLPFFADIGASALTDKSIEVPVSGLSDGVPVTYVPFRNGIFLSIAASIAEKEGAKAIYIGVVEEDSSGYPDCRDEYIKQMQHAINLGTKDETKIEIITPLVNLSKKDIVLKAIELDVPLQFTWSCYKNSDKACGVCDSCRLRLRGFERAGVKDPIEYA